LLLIVCVVQRLCCVNCAVFLQAVVVLAALMRWNNRKSENTLKADLSILDANSTMLEFYWFTSWICFIESNWSLHKNMPSRADND